MFEKSFTKPNLKLHRLFAIGKSCIQVVKMCGLPLFTTREPRVKYTLDNLHNRLTFDLGKKSKVFYYSYKKDPKISRVPKFGGELL